MKHLKFTPLVLAIAALSACHNGGVGVDSSARQKAATSSESGLKSDRSIQSSISGAATIAMPAAPLMVSALTPLARSNYLPPAPPGGDKLGNFIWEGAMASPLAAGDISAGKTLPMFSLLPIPASAYPLQGWPFNCFGCKKESDWARGMAREVIYANTILTELYPSISGSP